MPIYAYRCDSCGFEKDVLQKISDALLTQCPSCGNDAFRKQVTAAGFQLKGSGWYVTDFRGGKSGGAAGDKSAPEAGSKAAGEASPSSDGGKAAGSDSSTGAGSAASAAPAASTSTAAGTAGDS